MSSASVNATSRVTYQLRPRKSAGSFFVATSLLAVRGLKNNVIVNLDGIAPAEKPAENSRYFAAWSPWS